MTSPADYAKRLTTAGQAVGTDKPQLADTLAKSGLSDAQMKLVGGFTGALSLATANTLAQDSGVATNFNAQQLNSLDAIGEKTPNQPAPKQADSRSWLERAVDDVGGALSDGGSFLLHNPVTGEVLKGLDFVGDVAHMPARILSATLGGQDDESRNAQMTADGYDPNSTTSQLAFMFSHGESEYHSLDHARQSYGDDLVDEVVKMQADPEQYQSDLQELAQTNPTEAKRLNDLQNSHDFKQAYAAVDAMHISPGRDIANLVMLPFGSKAHTENNIVFKVLSGTLDAAYDWMADPTLVLGKVNAGIKVADALGRVAEDASLSDKLVGKLAGAAPFAGRRAGIQNVLDQAGIEATLATRTLEDGTKQAVTAVGRGWQDFLARAEAFRKQTEIIKSDATAEVKAAAEAARASIYTSTASLHAAIMPLWDEVNGTRVLAPKNLKFRSGTELTDTDLAPALDEQQLAATAGSKAPAPDSTVTPAADGQVATLTRPAPTGTPEPEYTKTLTSKVGGGWEATDGKPITELDDLAQYMASTGGLLRLSAGNAARGAMVMPGRISWAAERMAASKAAARSRWIDYTDKRLPIIPVDEEAAPLAALDDAGHDGKLRAQLGDVQHNMLRTGTADGEGFAPIKRARARMERVNRRLTTTLPTVKSIDLTDATSARDVEQFARFYLNKGDATKLAAAYSAGSLAERRAVVRGMLEQSFHASGLSKSDGGSAFMKKYLGDMDEIELRQKYGLGDTSKMVNDRGQEVEGALYNSQLASKVTLPSLRQMNYHATKFAVNSWAAKTGITGAGAVLQSNRMDALMSTIKMGWITSAAGGLRNSLDEVAGVLAKGMGREALKARVAFTQATSATREARRSASRDYQALVKQYGDHAGADEAVGLRSGQATKGLEQAQRDYDRAVKADAGGATRGDVLSVEDATNQLKAAQVERGQAAALESAIRYKVPLAFRGASDKMNDVLIGSALGKLMSVFGSRWEVTDEMVGYAKELQDQELRSLLHDGVFQTHFADTHGAIAGDDGAMALHMSGLQARKYKWQTTGSRYEGYKQVETDGGSGLDDWAKWMQLRFGDSSEASHSWVQTYHHTGGDVDAAKASVRAYLDEPAMKHFIDNAEIMQQLKDGTKVTNDELRSRAKDELSDRISADLLLGLSRRAEKKGVDTGIEAGEPGAYGISDDLLEHLANAGERGVPDRSWLANNVDPADRPQHTIGQSWAPFNAKHAPGKFPSGYSQMLTSAYGKVVTDQVNALSRNPLLTALYTNARQHTKAWEDHLVNEAGWDEDTAKQVVTRMALSHAEQEAFKHIDNPYVASQFSLISRNLVNFERAQEDWLRRWGRTIKDNPEIIRKAQLTLHAGTATGLVEHDDQGQLQFVYPGSAMAINVFNKAFRAMGLGDKVQIPVTGELTSQLSFLSPSLTQPFGLTGSPIISVPLKAMSSTLGASHPLLMSSLDKAVNGQMGAGRAWYEQLMPPTVNRIIKGVISDDPASTYGAAYAQALFAMDAGGHWDNLDGNDPTAINNAQQALATQVHNNLFLNTIFGFFAPAAPSVDYKTDGVTDSEGKHQGTTADWAAHIAGYSSLSDEARKALADLGPDKFRTYWAAVHPNERIYNTVQGGGTRTQVGTTSAYAPATIAAAEWMQDNPDFLKNYGGKGGVATYFMPAGETGTTDGTYSDVAYRAQLEDHMRSYKNLDSLLNDVIVQRGESQYYAAKSSFDDQISAAKARGDLSTASAVEDQWAQAKADIYAGNPLLAQKNASYATNGSEQQVAIGNLMRLLNDRSPATVKAIGSNRDGVLALLNAYQGYTDGAAALSGRRGRQATSARATLKDNYDANTAAVVARYPELSDLVNGVFKTPN